MPIVVGNHALKKDLNYIDIRWFGAKCDGNTIDTQAFIDAHDYLPSQGGTIYIPIGTTVVDAPVTFTKTVKLTGEFSHSISNASGSVVLMKNNGEFILRGHSSVAENFYIDGVKGATTGNGITMLCSRPILKNLSSFRQGGYGISIGDDISDGLNTNSWYMSNVRCRENGLGGIFIGDKNSAAPNANAGVATKIDVSYNTGRGLVLKNCIDNNFLSCHVEDNKSGVGVELINASGHTFLKPYLEINSFSGDATSRGNNIIGHRRDGNTFDFQNAENYFDEYVLSKGMYYLRNLMRVAKLKIANKTISGIWGIEQNTNRDLDILLEGTSANANVNIKHGGTGTVTLNVPQINVGSSTKTLKGILHSGGTRNFGSIPPQGTVDVTIALSGVTTDTALIPYTLAGSLPNGIVLQAFCFASGNVTLRAINITGSAIVLNQSVSVLAFSI